VTAAFWVALAVVIFGAFSYASASILQAVAARRCDGTVETMRHPLYLLGILCDMLAWVGSMFALRELAVYVVESVLAGSLAITVIAARFILKSRLRPRDVAAIVISLTALTVLSMSAGQQEEVQASSTMRWAFCIAAVGVVFFGVALTKSTAPAGAIAALGGLCLGSAALAGRALPMDRALTDPLTAALLTFAFTGMLLYANALGRGEVGPVTAIHWTAEVVVPSAIALFLLGDTVRPGWGLAASIAGAVTVAAAVLLATAPATSAAALPPDTVPTDPDRRALPAAPQPATPRPAERIIWWGPPPIWTPPTRTRAALAAHPQSPIPALAGRPMQELTWTPAEAQPVWMPPRRPDADAVPSAYHADVAPSAYQGWPASRPWDAYADEVADYEPVRATKPPSRPSLRPWDDL
jgi:hypothetical protein